MADFTTSGLTVRSLTEFISYLEERYKDPQFFGASIRTDPRSVFGQLIALQADQFQEKDELFQTAVSALTPSKSGGAPLSELVEFNGISRNSAVYTTGTVQVTANTAGTTIPAGSLVSNGQNQFSIDTQVVVGPSDVELVSVTAVEAGPIQAEAGTIDEIVTPVFGWASVTNLTDFTSIGSNEESDPRLRARRKVAASRNGGSTTPAIYTELANINSVTDVNIHWTQPRTINAVVEGGTDAEVAAALFNSVAGGTIYAGTESLYYTDPVTGQAETIRWWRVIEVPVYVHVVLQKLDGYGSTGDALVKQRIVEFFQGDLEIEDELVQGQTTGRNVVAAHIHSAPNSVPKCNLRGLYIDINPNPTSDEDISINFYQRAVTSTALITISEV